MDSKMNNPWSEIIWKQFGAAIDMFDNVLAGCPADLWRTQLYAERTLRPEFTEFWYIAYHAIFWLDYYLSDALEDYQPPSPYTLSELDPAGQLPDRVYSKDDLRRYLKHGRDKCHTRLASLTEDQLTSLRTDWRGMSVAGSFLYNMRHVQEHAAQLSLFLGQKIGFAPRWVSQAQAAPTD